MAADLMQSYLASRPESAELYRRARQALAGGGLLRAADRPEEVVRAALDRLPAAALAPRQARVVIDRGYVLAAAGLLAPAHPKVAADLLRHELPEAIS